MSKLTSEIGRFFALKKSYGFDAVLETVENFIFLYGILAISAFAEKSVNVFLFALWYLGWTIINEGVAELETEIRSDQFAGLVTTATSLWVIYLRRSAAYLVYGLLSLLLFLFLFNLYLIPELVGTVFTRRGLILLLVHLGITWLAFVGIIALTVRFERVATMVDLFYTLSIFLSGMVTPLVTKFAYSYWLVQVTSSFQAVGILAILAVILLAGFLFSQKLAVKKLSGTL